MPKKPPLYPHIPKSLKETLSKGEWRTCLNPNCKGQYHVTQEGVVDIPCPCSKRLQGSMRASAGLPSSEERRATTMDARFTVDCSACGFLFSEKTFAEALEGAKRAKIRHFTADEKIEIYDRLAQKGACNTWDADGKCIGHKAWR